jgi:hypothetical protein
MRKLNQKDMEILSKLVPEIKPPVHYRSILPPVSMHHASDKEDFQERVSRLDAQDLGYLADRILDGSECLLCISPEFAGIFLEVLEEKHSREKAEQIRKQYKSATGYEA